MSIEQIVKNLSNKQLREMLENFATMTDKSEKAAYVEFVVADELNKRFS